MKKRIAELEAKLDHTNAQPAPVEPAKAIEPASSVPAASLAAVSEHSPTAKPEKEAPFAFADWTWLNGNARTKTPAFDSQVLHAGDPGRRRLHLRFQSSQR